MNPQTNTELVGLIPAAGISSRLGHLPCSKELLPIGFQHAEQKGKPALKVVSHSLLEKMKMAKASKVYIILRNGKWDIPAYLGNGKMLGLAIAYLMADLFVGVPYTIDQATPFVQNSTVLFGFPDIIFEPHDAFIQLLNKQAQSKADLVIGIFKTKHPSKEDLIAFGKDNLIQKIVIKPARTRLRHTWIIAVWTPVFTRFLHDFVMNHRKENNLLKEDGSEKKGIDELYLGDVFQAAIQSDMKIEQVTFPHAKFTDIGTPADLRSVSGTYMPKDC